MDCPAIQLINKTQDMVSRIYISVICTWLFTAMWSLKTIYYGGWGRQDVQYLSICLINVLLVDVCSGFPAPTSRSCSRTWWTRTRTSPSQLASPARPNASLNPCLPWRSTFQSSSSSNNSRSNSNITTSSLTARRRLWVPAHHPLEPSGQYPSPTGTIIPVTHHPLEPSAQ